MNHSVSQPMMRRITLALLLVVLSVFLLFWRLDGALLWRDESTTANWARLMVESGSWLPYVYDFGNNQLIVQASDGHDVNSRLLPAMQSWLQFYVAAAGFQAFGADTAAARLPFAICGAATLFVLYRAGLVLFGTGLGAFLLPYLAVLSIFFLNAARQCRYYILVVLGASLLLLELFHYLRDPARAAKRSFYFRIAAYGCLLYFSNYVSFAATWLAAGVFIWFVKDPRLLRGFLLTSVVLGSVFSVEFWLFHAEFAQIWPPPEAEPALERYRLALLRRGSEFWRTIPLVFLAPAGFYLFRRQGGKLTPALSAAMGISVFLIWAPLTGIDSDNLAEANPAVSWAVLLLCLTVPATFFVCWKRIQSPGFLARAALLAGLVLVISPLFTIALGKNRVSTRHYFQILPAALVLTGLAASGLHRAGQRGKAIGFLAGVLFWPNLCFNFFGNDQVVERQFMADASYNGPLIRYLGGHIEAGDKVAFYRNVKGMMAYFYLPQMRWVALLDSDAPHNSKFRGRIPEDQFDDYQGADWYVVWDPRGGWPKGLNEDYEKVWQYTYTHRRSWWEWRASPRQRSYEVYRRVSGPVSPSGSSAQR